MDVQCAIEMVVSIRVLVLQHNNNKWETNQETVEEETWDVFSKAFSLTQVMKGQMEDNQDNPPVLDQLQFAPKVSSPVQLVPKSHRTSR